MAHSVWLVKALGLGALREKGRGGKLSPMLSHDVFFSLVDSSAAAASRLVDSCQAKLRDHPGVLFFSAGSRVLDLEREVNDSEFHVALHVVFDSRASHDAYQEAPEHHAFIEENEGNWAAVRVFDSEVSGGVCEH